jgi:beta-lactamase class A
LFQLSKLEQRSLTALVQIGPSVYSVELAVDTAGLIDGLYFRPTTASVPQSWSQVERQVTSLAPEVSMLAAKLNGNGTCTPVRSMAAETPRPLGSMFKLFVLGALANAVREHRVSWNQMLTVTAGIKVGGSGTLNSVPDGTRLTVEQTAIKMISVSDNTAADMLLRLVTRSAVENQVRAWSSHPSLDVPFLTVSEMFALKYGDFPVLADHYLALSPDKRASYLLSTVDRFPTKEERSSASPRDLDSIEWFASADDLCRAFAGLGRLEGEAGLGPIDKVLSTNTGGIGLSAKTWPRIWFKGGSEPGVLTLGYLARTNRGQSFVVIVLTEDAKKPVQESLAVEIQGLNAIVGAFGLLR